MIISALENLIPIAELYRNREEKEHFIATKPQLESFVINQLSQMEFFLIPIKCIYVISLALYKSTVI